LEINQRSIGVTRVHPPNTEGKRDFRVVPVSVKGGQYLDGPRLVALCRGLAGGGQDVRGGIAVDFSVGAGGRHILFDRFAGGLRWHMARVWAAG
jgi:hypothetical protein